MPAIPMSNEWATLLTDDWLALKAKWAEVAVADRADHYRYFQLATSLLDTGTRDQLIAAYKATQRE